VSDPIRVAEGLAKKAALTADRLRADRTPDPTVGVFVASEARRSERIYGVSVSIPLAGTYRNERMLQALQEAEAARTRLDGKRREVEMEVTETYIDAMGSYERWRLTSQGLTATQNSARLTQRAYSLGEVDLQGLLLARKQALDATSAAEQARVEALRAQSRLMIDAHLVWDLEED
jgi:outer membrane protein TolC